MEEVITFSSKLKMRSEARKRRRIDNATYVFLWVTVTYFAAHFLAAVLCGRFQ